MPLTSAQCPQTGSDMDLILTVQESLEGLSLLHREAEEEQCSRCQGYRAMRLYRRGRLSSAPAINLYRPCGNHGRSEEGRVAHPSLRILRDK